MTAIRNKRWQIFLLAFVITVLPAQFGFSQSDQYKVLLVASNGTVFLFDLEKQAVTQVGIEAQGNEILLSRGHDHAVVFGTGGLSVYRIYWNWAKLVAKVTSEAVVSASWLGDGASLVYLQEIDNGNGNITMQIFTWNAKSKTRKKVF